MTAPHPLLALSRIDRYLLRQLLLALLVTTGGLAALIWLTQSLRFVTLVVDRGLSLRVFIQLTGLLIPGFIAVILPITTFVVVQFIYQRLSGDRELTVMRATGMSPFALARPALMTAAVAAILCLILNVWLVPASYHRFRTYEFEIRNRMAAFLLQEGVFTSMSDNLTVYVRSRDRSGLLHGILIEDDRQPNAHATILAQTGALVTTDENSAPKVVLFNGSRQSLDHRTGRLNVLTFQRNTIDLASNGKGSSPERDAAEMSIPELLHPQGMNFHDRDRGKFAVEANRRLSSPFMALSFALVALVAVLSGGFSRHGNIWRPLGAIGIVVGLLAVQLTVQSIAAGAMALMPLVWVQAIAPGLVCAWWLFRRDTPAPRRAARPAHAVAG
jgi:lipopolysaccharide export system permease protein